MTDNEKQLLEYLLALEKERNDNTHRILMDERVQAEQDLDKPRVQRVKNLVKAKVQQLDSVREQRDKLLYNAGRYAAGARDSMATASNSIFEALMESEV